jgi:hypothetical protein
MTSPHSPSIGAHYAHFFEQTARVPPFFIKKRKKEKQKQMTRKQKPTTEVGSLNTTLP